MSTRFLRLHHSEAYEGEPFIFYTLLLEIYFFTQIYASPSFVDPGLESMLSLVNHFNPASETMAHIVSAGLHLPLRCTGMFSPLVFDAPAFSILFLRLIGAFGQR